MWIIVGGRGGRSWERSGHTHLIGIMFQRAVVAHVSNSIQVCVPLVNVVHVGAVVFLVQNA